MKYDIQPCRKAGFFTPSLAVCDSARPLPHVQLHQALHWHLTRRQPCPAVSTNNVTQCEHPSISGAFFSAYIMACRKEQPKQTYQTLAVPLVQIVYFCVALLQQLGQVPLV